MAERTKNEYRPSEVSPPGATLREILEERGISQAELAARTGRPKKTINEIIKGKAAITNQTALELELALGISAEFWNRREQHYREYLARQEERSRLEKNIKWLRGFPLSSMVKHGWIRRCSDKPTQLRELLQFFGVTSPEQWSELWARQEVAFRRSPKFRACQTGVATWLRQGMRTAEQTSCLPFDATCFRERLRDIRSLTRKAPAVFQPEVMRLCAEAGVAVAFVPGMPKSRVSGATRWLTPTKALIQLSLRYKTDDHLWFTFFHEAGHILLHGKRVIFLEGTGSDNDEEEQADRFAANLLIPPEEFKRIADLPRYTLRGIQGFAREIGIAPGIVVGRLQFDGLLPKSHCNGLKRRFRWVDAA